MSMSFRVWTASSPMCSPTMRKTQPQASPTPRHSRHQHRRYRQRNRRAVLDGQPTRIRRLKLKLSKRFPWIIRNQPPELKKLVTVDRTKTHITFRVRWQDATAYGGLINFIEKSKDTHLGDSVEMAGTGPVYVGYRLVVVMLRDLAVSFGRRFSVCLSS